MFPHFKKKLFNLEQVLLNNPIKNILEAIQKAREHLNIKFSELIIF